MRSSDTCPPPLSMGEKPPSSPADRAEAVTAQTQRCVSATASTSAVNCLSQSDASTSASMDLDVGFNAAKELLDEYSVEELFRGLTRSPRESDGLRTADSLENSAVAAVNVAPVVLVGSKGSSEPSNKKDHVKERVLAKPRRVTHKEEIRVLHGEVQQLTGRLQSLESMAARTTSAEMERKNQQRNTAVVSRSGPLWQQIAVKQLERRRKAEADNASLRRMLDMQVQEAKNLRRILKRRTKIEMMHRMLGTKRHKSLPQRSPEDDSQIFQELLQDMDELVLGVDDLFEGKGMDAVPCPGRRSQARPDVTDGVFFELTQKHMVPFDVRMTENAVWTALCRIGMEGLQVVKDANAQVHFHAQHSEVTGDTMMTSFLASTFGFKDLLGVQIRKVIRKYIKADRCVFICRMTTEPKLKSRQAAVRMHSTMCMVVGMVEALDASEEATSLMRSHFFASRHVPRDEEHSSPTDVDMAIVAWDEAISRIPSEVEDFLMDSSLQKN
ncbi:hypothetical protein BBJ28_00014983 [Nothophytophthora sp. Chile5]|nr:hypothetical protein BBJ28_00014983 [Nothophytophthora sp. Chile5]